MKYPANLRCKLAAETVQQRPVLPVRVMGRQQRKRTHEEVDDLLKTEFRSVNKSVVYDKLAALADKMSTREQESEESDDNYMPNDDDSEQAENDNSDQRCRKF